MAYSGTYDGVDWAVEGKILYLGDEDGYDQYFTYREDRTRQDYPWYTHTYVQKVIFRGMVYGQGSMAYMFYDYRNLTAIQNLQNFDFYGVTKTDYMFYNTEITSIDLSNKGCYDLNSMERMFAYCSRLKTVNFSGSTFGYEVNMTEMFMHCTALQSINFTNTGIIVKNMTQTFVGCSSLTTLTNLNIQFSEENNGIDLCFWLCSALNTNLIVSGIDGPSSYRSVFQDTTQPISIQFEEGNVSNEVKETWETIAKQRTNVYIVTNNPTSPQIIVAGERGKYENSIWTTDDESGTDLKITYQYTIYNDTLPVGVTNSVSRINTSLSSDSNWTETKIDADNIIYYKPNSSDTDTHKITITIKDAYNKTGTATVTIAGIYALLDLKAGGEGMAIGKVAEKKGLEIRFPTMIGEGLFTPLVDGEINLNKYQLVVGKYNKINNDAIFVVGNGSSSNDRRNIMEVVDGRLRLHTQPDAVTPTFYMDFCENNSAFASIYAEKNGNTYGITISNTNLSSGYSYQTDIRVGDDNAIKLINEQYDVTQALEPLVSRSKLQVNSNSIEIGANNITLTSAGALTVGGKVQDGSGNVLANKLNKTDLTVVNKTIKDNQTVAGGDYVDIEDVDISETGKTPIGVVGFRAYNASSSGSNGAAAVIQAAYLSGNKANCRLHNRSNNSMKVQVHFYILYRTT